MKKVVCLICVFVLLSCGGIVTISAAVNQNKDTVTITETVQYGDVSLADDFQVNLKMQYDDHLFWDTAYEKSGEGRTDTEFRFYAQEYAAAYEYENTPVSIHVSYETHHNLYTPVEELRGFARAYREIYDRTEPGTEVCETVYVKEYYDYYPLMIRLELPDYNAWIQESWIQESSGAFQYEKELFDMFSEFFKIPVAEDEVIKVVIDRDESDGMMTQNIDSAFLHLYSESVVTDDGMCYFALSHGTEDGGSMDCSMIPGGYGLYAFRFGKPGSYSGSGVDLDSLKMVHSLKEGMQILHFTVNKEQTKLLLFTEEERENFIYVIDRGTMELSQRVKLPEWGEIHEYDDFFVIKGELLTLFTVAEDGKYEQRFSIPVRQEDCPALMKMDTGASMDYDGKHLIIASWVFESEYAWMPNCDFSITICGPEGIAYYGIYENSLATNSEMMNYRENCVPFGSDAIVVKWN